MKKEKACRYLLIFMLLISCMVMGACQSRKQDFPDQTQQTKPEEYIELMEERVEKKAKKNVLLEGKNIGGLKESEIREKIVKYATKVDKPVKDTAVNEKTWEVILGQEGKKVDVQGTLDKTLNAAESEKIKLIIENIKPAITSKQLQQKVVEIGNYSTPLLNRGKSRINNIGLAAKQINFKKIAPGEEFSFNKTVGRRTEAKGYEEAPIIIKTENGPQKGKGVGGGICQISSTIYNAIEECGMEVIERHLHSKDVGYVPKGEDATVVYNSIDFRFRNVRKHPIMLRVYLTNKRVTVRVIENKN